MNIDIIHLQCLIRSKSLELCPKVPSTIMFVIFIIMFSKYYKCIIINLFSSASPLLNLNKTSLW